MAGRRPLWDVQTDIATHQIPVPGAAAPMGPPTVPRPGEPTVDPVEAPEVAVLVLGPVEVVGAARPFTRAWTLDLVAYLALHPRGVDYETWATALWPDRLMAAPTLYSTVSAARRSLGRSRRGHDHLPRHHGTLRLAGTVGTDWDLLCRLAAGPDPRQWWRGLSLVRGRPFEGLRSPDWTVLEGVAATVEDGVVDLAVRLAEHHLGEGDGRRAARAARRALLASPYDERLYRILLRAADQEGNPAGVESAMADLVRLVGGGGAGGGTCVHPDTAALYRSLSRRRAGGRGTGRLGGREGSPESGRVGSPESGRVGGSGRVPARL